VPPADFVVSTGGTLPVTEVTAACQQAKRVHTPPVAAPVLSQSKRRVSGARGSQWEFTGSPHVVRGWCPVARMGKKKSRNSLCTPWPKEQEQLLRAAVIKYGETAVTQIARALAKYGRTEAEVRGHWKATQPLIKGAWTRAEDDLLRFIVTKSGAKRWSKIAEHIPRRNAKQCRERWVNNLDSSVSKAAWTPAEDKVLVDTQKKIGNRWSEIAKLLPGRCEQFGQCVWGAVAWAGGAGGVRGGSRHVSVSNHRDTSCVCCVPCCRSCLTPLVLGRPDNAVKNRWYSMMNRQRGTGKKKTPQPSTSRALKRSRKYASTSKATAAGTTTTSGSTTTTSQAAAPATRTRTPRRHAPAATTPRLPRASPGGDSAGSGSPSSGDGWRAASQQHQPPQHGSGVVADVTAFATPGSFHEGRRLSNASSVGDRSVGGLTSSSSQQWQAGDISAGAAGWYDAAGGGGGAPVAGAVPYGAAAAAATAAEAIAATPTTHAGATGGGGPSSAVGLKHQRDATSPTAHLFLHQHASVKSMGGLAAGHMGPAGGVMEEDPLGLAGLGGHAFTSSFRPQYLKPHASWLGVEEEEEEEEEEEAGDGDDGMGVGGGVAVDGLLGFGGHKGHRGGKFGGLSAGAAPLLASRPRRSSTSSSPLLGDAEMLLEMEELDAHYGMFPSHQAHDMSAYGGGGSGVGVGGDIMAGDEEEGEGVYHAQFGHQLTHADLATIQQPQTTRTGGAKTAAGLDTGLGVGMGMGMGLGMGMGMELFDLDGMDVDMDTEFGVSFAGGASDVAPGAMSTALPGGGVDAAAPAAAQPYNVDMFLHPSLTTNSSFSSSAQSLPLAERARR